MKALLCILFLIPIFASAQKTAAPATDPSDTIKITRLKHNKPEVSNGFKMGTAYDIWENISQTPRLSTLAKLIRSSGLIATFRSNGPLTLFAPNNAAFARLPKSKMDTLLKRRHVLDLSNLLTCQAVPGRLDFGDLEDLVEKGSGTGKLITLGGNVILLKKSGEDMILTDEKGNQYKIIAPDLVQHNGYIHVINGVLMPKPRVM